MNRLFFLALSCLTLLSSTTIQTQAADNTMLRFRIGYAANGTNWTNIDVELFDSEKPVTVSNFLAYVESGAYHNSLVHRLIPGFVLQGGAGTIANPYSRSPFQYVEEIEAKPAITNEFAVGPLRSNVFGTLAMAKRDGDPDSATSSWFFNLWDNSSNLDNQNGGFTVFGRVVAGLDVLHFFNDAFAANEGILDTFDLFLSGCHGPVLLPDYQFEFFEDLPVGYYGLRCPLYEDLIIVQIIPLTGAEFEIPAVTITSPTVNETVIDGPDVTLSGTASDDVGISHVEVYVGDTNPVVRASGTNSWSVTLTNLSPGPNTITVVSVDTSDNASLPQTRSFFLSVRTPLQLSQTGAGTVSGHTNGEMLEIGREYSLVAEPDPDNFFNGWIGTESSTANTLRFIMAEGTSLTARFVTNLFLSEHGTYTGLFYNTNQVEQRSSGFLTLKLSNRGTYSAKLLMDRSRYRLSGTFGVDGTVTNQVDRKGTTPLLVCLALDPAGMSDRLTGMVSNLQGTVVVPELDWSAELKADRAVFHTRHNPTPLAGSYTLIVPSDTNSPAGPPGDGFGKVKVSANGKLSMAGTLADGTRANQRVGISREGYWPMYISLDRGAGALIGWLLFDTNQPMPEVGGRVHWFKQSQLKAKYYKTGFTNETVIQGSLFTKSRTNLVLNFATNAMISFREGDLTSDFANEIWLGPRNKVTNLSDNKLSLRISASTGLFNGTAVTPDGMTRLRFKGAVLQNQNLGSGFFLGPDNGGHVLLSE